MLKYFILRDMRLNGYLPLVASTLITANVNGSISLSTAFSRINIAAQINGKLDTLFVLCHGYQNSFAGFSFGGGQGLQLGAEDLNATNVKNWAAIKNSFKYIVIYACGTAYTGISSPITPTVMNDGKALMINLAKQTNATVFAAEQTQWYFPNNYDFGNWEGTVYMFTPAGNVYPGSLPVYEIMEVI